MEKILKHEKRDRRHRRVRAKIFGTVKVPRLCVFKSNKHIYVQLIDDEKSKTLMAVADKELKKQNKKGSPINIADKLGELIAQKAIEKDIKKVVFDRGGYKYHGQVKALAEGARKGGLQF